ncbi:MAG: phenylacetate-CoA oxygenase subunit PaaC [Chitinophagaceae bacterium]|nr:phenylacetate-CoA oxygenase subunit PaaC [Chitinophagaceae bacterium]MCW5906141.1 phenylacetate-CoA oxygenase subunit PaaC [Chitinophagaceae bacterium]
MPQTPNPQPLTLYLLHLADSTLILSHRNSEWCGHAPILEQDIALTNIALDLLGQARNFYQYAAELINQNSNNERSKVPPLEGFREATEDSLAYLRIENEYKNLLLTELPNEDWAHTILRQFYFSTFQFYLFQQLQQNNDEHIVAIAAKAIKEISYHVRWSGEWVVRLGDGTTESHNKMLKAIDTLKNYTGEMFIAADYETAMNIDIDLLKNQWNKKVKQVFEEATLPYSLEDETTFHQTGGKIGTHTEYLGYILTEMQYLQRTYPNSIW